MSDRRALTRRLVIGGVMLLAAAGAGLLELPRLMRKRYAPSPFDDLFDGLPDRDASAALGQVALRSQSRFDRLAAAKDVRARLSGTTLAALMESELSDGKVSEAGGWVLPASFVLVCALAASV